MTQTKSGVLPSAETLLAEARSAQGSGQFARAVELLEAVLQTGEHAQALNMLGLILLQQGDASRGRELLIRATAADPAAAPLWINLAKAHRHLKDDEGERTSLTTALDRDPYLLIAHVRKAELHARLGEEAQAVEEWQAVLTICSGDQQGAVALRALAEQARAYIEPRALRMAVKLDQGLREARIGHTPEETRRFDTAVAHALGTRQIYTSHSSGLHFPFLPADEFFPRAHFPWLESLERATDAIRAEFEAALNDGGRGFAPYVDQPTGAAENIWSELSRSTRWSAYYLWRYGVRNDSAREQCPKTAALLESLPKADQPSRAPTAFFSLLAPGTRIPPHTGVSNTRAIVHLPLVVPAGCGFRVGGETRQWRIGEAFVFDDTIEHEAWNDSKDQRAVLIFDVWNPHLSASERDLLRAFYGSADKSMLDPAAATNF